jgi:IS30 family transposase
LKKLQRKTSEATKIALTEALAVYKDYVHTITSDNGSEFARHEEVSMELNADFFFAHPYSSWERGLNENTNGLVRQYLKKGSEFTAVTNQDLAIIETRLNSRPRKTLGYKSPNEVFKM